MKKVYVAGPYSDDDVIAVLRNIGRGEYYAAKIFEMGFAPFTPWHDKDFVIKNWRNKNLIVSKFLKYSIEWLKVSDIMFVVPNFEGLRDWEKSGGTLIEIMTAKEMGIPVVYSISELKKFL